MLAVTPVPQAGPARGDCRRRTVGFRPTRLGTCVRVSTLETDPRAVLRHLLGLYLGDGHLAAYPRTVRLVITCDAAYSVLVDACAESIERVELARRVRVQPDASRRCVRVVADSKRWPEAFRQHGPGRKHDRKIELRPWQREIVDRFPQEFLRGLLHSDGWRTVNRFSTRLPSGRVAEYAYPRWFFSNRSTDIRALFCEYCDRLGIRWTQSNPRNISVSHRTSVALLDSFVPAKS
jgi:hypothetical protein